MKEKKLEWAKPALEYLGTAVANGKADTCLYSNCNVPNCEGGQAAPAKCAAGTGGPL